jgi:hypothetical protein
MGVRTWGELDRAAARFSCVTLTALHDSVCAPKNHGCAFDRSSAALPPLLDVLRGVETTAAPSSAVSSLLRVRVVIAVLLSLTHVVKQCHDCATALRDGPDAVHRALISPLLPAEVVAFQTAVHNSYLGHTVE